MSKSHEDPVQSIRNNAIQQLERITDKVKLLQDHELKNQLDPLMIQLNALKEANEKSDLSPNPELLTREKLAHDEWENLSLKQSQLRWEALQQSLLLAATLLTDKDQAKEVVSNEIALLTDTAKYLTMGINNPEYFSSDLTNEQGSEFKSLQTRIESHINTCGENKDKIKHWGELLGTTSRLVGIALCVIGVITIAATLGAATPAGLTLLLAGLGMMIGGTFGQGMLEMKSLKQDELVGKKIKETLHAAHSIYKPKSEIGEKEIINQDSEKRHKK